MTFQPQNVGMSGHNFDAFVSSQRTFNDYDLTAKIQEKYYRARQKFLAKIEKKEDSCIILSDSKLDAKLEIYRSIDRSCGRLTEILENYQNCLFVYSNEENSLAILLKECGKHDKTKAGKIMSIVGKSLSQASHQRIRLYMPLLRLYQEMETFHSRAVTDTTETVDKLEERRSQYRASLLWMKDLSEKLDPDIYRQLDKFRRVQNQVRADKKAFDSIQMDVVQKIDLLMASRCNLINQILASYQSTLLATLEKNYNNFKSIEEMIRKEDLYEYEFKVLKQLNPLQVDDLVDQVAQEAVEDHAANGGFEADLVDLNESVNNNDIDLMYANRSPTLCTNTSIDLVDISSQKTSEKRLVDRLIDTEDNLEPEDIADELEEVFGSKNYHEEQNNNSTENLIDTKDKSTEASIKNLAKAEDIFKQMRQTHLNFDLLNMDSEDQVANLLEPSKSTLSKTIIESTVQDELSLTDFKDAKAIDSKSKEPTDLLTDWPDEWSKIFGESSASL